MSMNGEAATIPQIGLVNPVVDLLEKALIEAKAGRLNTLGLILVSPQGGVGLSHVGGRVGDLYVGIGMLQRAVEKVIDNQGRSPILRPIA